MNIKPIILCGGAGTRLWPLSRELYPKQLLSLVGDNSLLQDTVLRVGESHRPMLVCNEEHRFMVAEQLREIGVNDAEIILEPVGRNTAPAVAVAAHRSRLAGDDPILAVLPSDHVIADVGRFDEALGRAMELADEGYLVTFGVTPNVAETGYGYVKTGSPVSAGFLVDRFVEKPDAETAAEYLRAGGYYWNSGMFVFRASRFLEELETWRPDIFAAIASTEFKDDHDFVRIGAGFSECPAESLDYAVMEKTDRAAMVPLDAGWSDIGSWSTLWEVSEKDTNGNAVRGDVMLEHVRDSYIRAEHRLVSAVGIEDLVIVETADAVMIASKDEAQNVRKLVSSLKSCERTEHTTHRKVFRPWGHYETVNDGERFQVKHIEIKPGASLSLQLHHHRAEHWVVVRGTARVTRGDEVFQLSENESTYIPIGTQHRLENPGKIPLRIIEIQSGSYLGEDDIVRFEDNYGRD